MGDPDPKSVLQFEVNLLNSTGGKFEKLAADYAHTMKTGATPFKVPSSGGKPLDNLVKTVLQLFSEVHTEIADAVYNHGDKLQRAAQNYDQAEQTTVNSLLKMADSDEFVTPGTPTIH